MCDNELYSNNPWLFVCLIPSDQCQLVQSLFLQENETEIQWLSFVQIDLNKLFFRIEIYDQHRFVFGTDSFHRMLSDERKRKFQKSLQVISSIQLNEIDRFICFRKFSMCSILSWFYSSFETKIWPRIDQQQFEWDHDE